MTRDVAAEADEPPALGRMLRAARLAAGRSQLAVAVASGVALHDLDALESDDPRAALRDLVAATAALGLSVVLTHAVTGELLGGRPLAEPAQWPRLPARTAPDSDLAGALDQLAAVAAARRRRQPPVVAVVDAGYAGQLTRLLWGAETPERSWAELPTWHGLPVSVAPWLDDVAELRRLHPPRRWRQRIASVRVTPDDLDPAAAQTYRVLRDDGFDLAQAAAAARLLMVSGVAAGVGPGPAAG